MKPIFDSGMKSSEEDKDFKKNEKEWRNYENNMDNLQLVFHHEKKDCWESEIIPRKNN